MFYVFFRRTVYNLYGLSLFVIKRFAVLKPYSIHTVAMATILVLTSSFCHVIHADCWTRKKH